MQGAQFFRYFQGFTNYLFFHLAQIKFLLLAPISLVRWPVPCLHVV